jgi:hypothetical protein
MKGNNELEVYATRNCWVDGKTKNWVFGYDWMLELDVENRPFEYPKFEKRIK